MILVSPSDTFEVSKMSLVGDVDKDILFDFYAPIVGAKNVLYYFLLLRDEALGTQTYSSFFSHYQLSQSEFVNGFSSLEAIGLVKTYVKKEGNHDHYLYCLYGPKTPSEFFSNELLNALLFRFLDEKERERLKKKYSLKMMDVSCFKDVSLDFSSYFQIDNDSLLSTNVEKEGMLSRKAGTLKLYFDKNLFFAALRKELPDVSKESLSQEEVVRVARIMTLHGFDEETIASFVARSFEPNKVFGSKVNFDRLRQLALDTSDFAFTKKEPILATESNVSGQNSYAKTIRLMDKMGSIEFLSMLQKGHKPAKSDLAIIDCLVNEIGLPENVTNALIFFTISTNGNTLNANYLEKVGASLVRADITNALDAYNYLIASSSKKGYVKPLPNKKVKKEVSKEKEVAPKESKEETDDFDDILNSL